MSMIQFYSSVVLVSCDIASSITCFHVSLDIFLVSEAEQTYNPLVRILVFVGDSYLFGASSICWVMKSRNQYHHTCRMSMIMMSTSNFEYEDSKSLTSYMLYEYEYNEYFELWIWVENGSILLKKVWMRINNRNNKYDSILLICGTCSLWYF